MNTTNFNFKFIIQFIIDMLVFGIGATIIVKVLQSFIINGTSISGFPVCWMINLTNCLFNIFTMVLASFSAQKYISKMSLTDFPEDPVKFYLIFAAVITGINIMFSVFGFSSTYGVCVNNMDEIEMSMNRPAGQDAAEFINQLKDKIRNTVIISLIIGNAIEAGVIFTFAPVLAKRHNRLFEKQSEVLEL